MSPGRFISLEGGEGAGKSTQARAIVTALAARDIPAIMTREPGGSGGAEAIRALLLHGDAGRWDVRAEALLFAAARADHVARTIRPAIDSGTWVVCDRFVDSTRAYQGGSDGLDDTAIMALHRFGSGGLLPDRTFVLALDPEEGNRRATARDGAGADRFARRDQAFHMAVAERFRAIAAREADRVRLIPADREVAAVTAAILADLADLIP